MLQLAEPWRELKSAGLKREGKKLQQLGEIPAAYVVKHEERSPERDKCTTAMRRKRGVAGFLKRSLPSVSLIYAHTGKELLPHRVREEEMPSSKKQ